ncbi:uncharacterized protein LOC119322157 isoform X2 [Triticum dicoccoides]|uniref:uncharacterized protein LOC119322157 isoform X1 n=1 Tax=Triticum dicoccoides TaxID=85692 RepID=UPI00162EEDA1|nr:uncharacterized protein LOC119322157 isoform X1 [Triticum dicoccoides]XP_037451548.1 uncharacterized protein LOC119322157 isoform X2 [Triticum dicoccoides]
MRTEVIKADTIDVAVKRILNELNESRQNVIYFDGWEGLGASSVLRDIARRLELKEPTRPPGLDFEQVFHIDCSKWESTRALQREIAEQLKLPNWVMKMFDNQDEEDDFNGIIDQSSRTEIADVAIEIQRSIQGRRFLAVLHNGSNEDIDISRLGLSVYPYLTNKVVWTFQGRFRMDPKMVDSVKKSKTTDVIVSASSDVRDPRELWLYLVHQEAVEVSFNKHGHCIINPEIAAECVLYMLKQSWISSQCHMIEYDWAIHSSNYWACDGIIALTEIDQSWQVSNALQRELLLLLDMDNRPNGDESRVVPSSSHLARSVECMPYWISTTTCGLVVSPSGAIPDNLFQNTHRLGVLKLSRCTFSFSSPPFLCCQSLRFLWLENCKDLVTSTSTTNHHPRDAHKEQELESSSTTSWECFQSLWVLDLRYTDWDQILSARVLDVMTQVRELNVMGARNWDISHIRGRLCNIRKLRITKSTCFFNNNVFSEMENMELLDFSGNHITQGMTCLSGPASTSLKSVIIDGCDGLENISFRGCKELSNVLLKGLFRGLEELELSGTRVKVLNLTGMEARSLPRQIIILGCEKLRAILWPLSMKKEGLPKVLHINTTSPSVTTYRGEAPPVHPHADLSLHQQKEEIFKGGWRICITDARLLSSLSPIERFLIGLHVHIDICPAVNIGGSSDKLVQVHLHTSTLMDSKYRDVLKEGPVAAMMMCDGPKIQRHWNNQVTCFIKLVMHGQGNRLLEDAAGASTSALLLPKFLCELATSLHVYDNLSITSIPGPPQGSKWSGLRWCCVERCPRLHTLFQRPPRDTRLSGLSDLGTLWASKLLSALYMWDNPVESNFVRLILLHLDHCPRLVHGIPLSRFWDRYTMRWLETIEIVYCGDIREVFPLSPERHEQDKIRVFRDLRRIHLHELPKLQRICGFRMSAPKLETIKIRGCWSLKRVPAIGRNTKPPKVDCEKEWWDNLEWDGLEKYHHPSLYEPSHSLYYKAQLPRGTVLR